MGALTRLSLSVGNVLALCAWGAMCELYFKKMGAKCPFVGSKVPVCWEQSARLLEA